MSHASPSRLPRPISFLFENSIFLIAGAIAALLWANTNDKSYHAFVHYTLVGGDAHQTASHAHEPGHDDGTKHIHEHEHKEHAEADERNEFFHERITTLSNVLTKTDTTTGSTSTS